MIKTIKTGIVLTAALLLAWLLPWCYTFVFASPSRTPFTLYSGITHGFASVGYNEQGKFEGRDFSGNTYTDREFDSILPIFYCRQLAAEGRFPTRIEGVELDVREAERSKFMFRSTPRELNRRRPQIYQLLESMPARVDLEAPSDVFRITDHGIEFVDMETNTIDRQKSDAFSRAMKRKGFEFPARVVAGNASTRKEYDNGYLLVDDASRVFHLKQVRGRPFVRRTDIPAGLGIGHMFVAEFRDRRLLGLLVDKDHRLHVLETDYSLHALPVGPVDPRRESLTIVGDLFYWTVQIGNAGSERLIAVNARDYTRVDEHVFEPMAGAWQRRFGYLFPFSLSFTSSTDGYVEPRLGDFSLSALWLGLALGIGYALLCRRPLGGRWWRAAGIVVLGLYLLIPLLAMNGRKQ